MIVMKGKEYFERIIYRHLNQESTPEEEILLAVWLNEHPENQAEYEHIVNIWTESSKLALAEEFDKTAAWQSLENKISALSIKSSKKYDFFSRSFKIAAAIILLGLLAELVYFLIGPKSPFLIEVAALHGNQKVQLPDSTVIMLRKGSSLHYDHEYPLNGRRVELAGEAYFDVQHDAKRPFSIQTDHSIIRVLGTSFMVRSNRQTEQVFVTRGTVKITERKDSTKQITLSAGQSVSIIGNIFDKGSITDSNYLSWQSGILQFDNVTLRKMITDLNQNFQADISLTDALAAKSDTIRVNFRFENSSLEQVLDEIHVTTGWTVERKGREIILRE
jgi:transmembrane sensor